MNCFLPFLFVLLTALPQAHAELGLENKQGSPLDADAFTFQNEDAQAVKLSSFFVREKPVMLAFVYFDCPGTCTLLLNGMIAAMSPHIFLPGRDFEVVVVSIDPKDTPVLAKKKKQNYLDLYGRADTAAGWHFLVGTQAMIEKLTNSVGFHYEYDTQSGQYNHLSALFFFTPRGTLSTILTGVKFESREFRGAVGDAASGRLGTFIEKVNAFCVNYLPHRGWLNSPSRWLSAFLAAILMISLMTTIFLRRRRAPCDSR